jgi:DNA-binding transcriptional LysR family regulator
MGYAAMHELDWDDLRFFLSVAARGSISGAAQELRTSHSTVLRRLASLEKKLGARLFKRLPSGYVITSAGERLRERLAGVAEQIAGAQRQLGGLDTRPSGVVRITSTDTLTQGTLMPLIAEFQRMQPEITLQLAVNNTFMSLTKREADVAIRPTSRPSENLVGRKVGYLQTALYASRSYWKAHARRPWAEHRWIVPDETLAHLAQARWAAKHVPMDRIALSVDTLVGMASAVRAGVGIGLLLTLLADDDDQLVRIHEAEPQLDTDVWILTHADLKQVPRIHLFTDFMYRRLRTHPALARSP